MIRFLKDSRRSTRTKHDSVLELFDQSGRLLAGTARLVDLSAVGVGFTSTHVFAKGEPVRGRVRLLNIGLLVIAGRVVRVKERTNCTFYGVEFDSVKAPRPGASAAEKPVP